jgi:hypothetical protein
MNIEKEKKKKISRISSFVKTETSMFLWLALLVHFWGVKGDLNFTISSNCNEEHENLKLQSNGGFYVTVAADADWTHTAVLKNFIQF